MSDDGLMVRVLEDPTGAMLLRARFQTGDDHLDKLLEEARAKFLESIPPASGRRRSRGAWDAWERLKTVLDPEKKRGVGLLLDGVLKRPGAPRHA